MPGGKCALKVSARHRSAALEVWRLNRNGAGAIKWDVPNGAPSGTWSFVATCEKGKAHSVARTKIVLINHGSGTGSLVQAANGGGKGGGNQSCQPVEEGGGGNVCFINDPFASYQGGTDVGQCTWYAAGMRPDLDGVERYDASTWLTYAQKAGIPTGSVPVAGSIAVNTTADGGVGHVAYVAGVTNGGTTLILDEANLHNDGGVFLNISTPAADFQGYIYGGPAGNGPSSGTSGSGSGPSGATGPIGSLGFVKLFNTSGGTVEVHWDTVQGGAYRRVGDFASDFSPGDAGNGTWDLFGSANGAPQLGFIKLRNTGSGNVEVHWDTLQGSSYKRVGDFTSDFSSADAGNGVWQLFGSANGAPELGFIKLSNTGSGNVEVHWDTLQGSSYKRVGDFTSDFSSADAGNGVWQLFGSANGAPELGFIKLSNTGSGNVEVHWDTLQGSSYKRVGDFTSDFSSADAGNGSWNLFGSANGAPELGFVKLQNSGSGTVEGHADALEGTGYARIADYASDFSSGDASNGIWQIGTY